MWQQILICSARKDFLKYVQENLEDLDYSLRLIKKLSDISQLDAGYLPAVIVVDGADSSWRNSFDLVKSRYGLSQVLIVQEATRALGVASDSGLGARAHLLLRPTDDEFLVDFLLKVAPVHIPAEKLKLNYVTPVRTCDIVPGGKFEFDLFLYMPANEKILLYIRKQSEITQDHLEKFKKYSVVDLFIRKTDAALFESYSADMLNKIYTNDGMSETARRQRLQNEVRDLFSSFFTSSEMTPRESQEALDKCKNIVSKFLAQVYPHPEFHQQIMAFVAKNHTHLTHATNVAVFASLFTLALGIPHLEAVAIGGLLHDIGFSKLPAKLFETSFDDLTEEEKNIYRRHPEESINLLAQKNVPLSPETRDVILQHHESFGGGGFPRGLSGQQIDIRARLCQIADQFDYRTSVHAGSRPLSPLLAIDELMMANEKFGSQGYLDLQTLGRIRELFTGAKKVSIQDRAQKLLEDPIESTEASTDVTSGLKRARRRQKSIKRA